jgi:hypothetical protein
MAKMPNGILGGIIGTIGPVVGTHWKGKPVIRSRPSGKRHRSSEDQLKQQAKVKVLTPFISPLTYFLNRTYQCVAGNTSCFNKAMSYNLRNAIGGEFPAFRINYALVAMGLGDLLNVEKPEIRSESSGRLTFIWKDNSNEGSARATDQFFATLYCEELKKWETRVNGPQRMAANYTLDVPGFSGKAVHIYVGFLSSDARFVTTSLYAGFVQVL